MLGNSRMLLPHFELYPFDLVQRDFGSEFARSLITVQRGRWEGPIPSGFGLHLVRVEKIVPARRPNLSEVRAAVARDYEEDRRMKSLNTAYRKLRQDYRVEYTAAWNGANEH